MVHKRRLESLMGMVIYRGNGWKRLTVGAVDKSGVRPEWNGVEAWFNYRARFLEAWYRGW